MTRVAKVLPFRRRISAQRGQSYWIVFGVIVSGFLIILFTNAFGGRPYLHDYHDLADLLAPYAPTIVALTVFCFAVLRDRDRSRRMTEGSAGYGSQAVDPSIDTSTIMGKSRRLSTPGLVAFFQIADAWRLSITEQQSLLGGVAKQTMCDWKARPEGAQLSVDELDRISYVLGIYEALHILIGQPEQADAWIRRENSAIPFGGRPASDVLFSGHMEDLILIRRYLDGAGGPW